MDKNIIALLPMKKHSERVPNKNLRDFSGKPLYHRVMESLSQSKYIKEVCINTDSKQISENAISNFDNVRIIERPEELMGDIVAMNDIIDYDISKLEGEHFLQTHSTNPLLTADTIDRAIEEYFENLSEFDSLFSVNRLQTRLYWQNGEPVNHNPQELLRTQDLPPLFEENSNIYIFSRESFKNAGNRRIGLKPQMFEMNNLESIDIDEPEDFILAETLYKQLRDKL
ncbi:acylneuraminate cytidylyltransferase family protein [Methanococcoides orientis]|uniref:acylneuraminate cytidylyltransferase family protein n=1 Tax=Methanococcoides orientis TaxID=2822137 RepID=UPI001E5D00F1|nr:acylneuraminate cytidylyltransferase family protein [Methanococcoides orientis]UGV40301.1 acylneuraminate cytidylyltransferase family protein [Methanococcoides orientis]